jgi:outer membrane protein assembly factor BamB
MPDFSKLKSLAPLIAIAIILLVFVVAEYWVLPARRAAQQATPEAKPPELPAPVSTSAAAPATAPVESAATDAPVSGALPPVVAATSWSTYHGDTSLSGYTDLVVPERPRVLWQVLLEGTVRQAPVADANGLYVVTTTGLVVALDFAGKERWRLQLAREDNGLPKRIEAPLAVFQDALLVASMCGHVHALDAASGQLRWVYTLEGEVLGSPMPFAPADATQPARVYVIQREEGVLHSMDFRSGQALTKGEAISRCDGSPAIVNGLLVYGSCDFALHVHDAADGKLLKNIRLCDDCQVASGPALVGDHIYAGSRAGYFYCADARTGGIIWTNQDCTKEVFTTPAIAADTVVFGAEDGVVFALDRATGRTRWKHEGEGVLTSPVIAGEHVLLGVDGALQALALATGAPVWMHAVSDAISSPAIINDMIVVGSEDGTVLALGTAAT